MHADDRGSPASHDPWPGRRGRDGGIDEIPLAVVDGEPLRGRLWICGKHAIGPDVEATLAEVGATTVVCLTEEFELADRYPNHLAWLRRHRDHRAVVFPIPDLHAPPLADVLALLDDLYLRLVGGEGIVIHCAAGIGRSGTVAACLLMRCGMDASSALAHVAAHRPMAGPEAGSQRELVGEMAAALAVGR